VWRADSSAMARPHPYKPGFASSDNNQPFTMTAEAAVLSTK
jgi:hypothetical protein